MWNYTQLSVRILASQFFVCLVACSSNAAQEPSTNPAPKEQSSPIASPTNDDGGPKNDLKAEQPKSVIELSEEEIAEVRAAERFFSILEKNPRRGTAFDRVYSHHIDFGTLEKLLVTLRERTQKTPEDGIAWQLLGLFELHRGQHQAAVKQLVQAEKLRETDPLASYYLGLAQAADGDFTAAVGSLERAIERKPQRTDLLEIYQQLGRFHLRAQRIDEALAAWKRLEELFPNDPRVLEEIAVALVQEEKLDLAKQHYTRLLPVLRDDFKRSSIQIQIAELTTQLGDKASGIAQLESILSSLKPDSWLFRDVRRRIDETFLKAKDQDGLVKYYENWLAGHGEDLDAMSRLARFLNSVGRSKEAMDWSEKAIRFAPTLVDLRKSHIQLLVESSLYGQAIEQYRQLTQLEPANIDHLKQWGILIMRQSNLPEAQRGQQALAVWQKIIEKSPEDAVTVSQVADLCLQHKLFEPAESYYRQAVKLAPDDVQYREYLGEFLHRQKRVDEALVVWSEITSGSRETSSNLSRVAEIYNNFGFTEKANSSIARAAELSPKDFQLQVLAAKMHNRANLPAQALTFIANAEALASDAEERDTVIGEKISALQVTKQLVTEAGRLQQQLQNATAQNDKKDDDKKDTTQEVAPQSDELLSQQYYRLARYWEACRQWGSARKAAEKATALNPRELAPRILCGRIAELTKNYAEAAKIFRELAAVDRRSRAAHWMKVSEIELLAGHTDEAIEAALQLVQSAPTDSANHEFYANVCFKAGKTDQAIAALRKAIRIEPEESALLITLAKSLAENKKTDEAIEMYFRALAKSDEIDDMLEIVKRLTPLYQTNNSTDRLLERLESSRKLPEMERKITICIAQVWRILGDLRKARQQLEQLYNADTKDTILLSQISKLCQETGDMDAAIKYQRQLVSIAPGAETELPLADLLFGVGKEQEARAIMTTLLVQDPDPVHQMVGIDNLIKRKDWTTSLVVLESLVAKHPNDWELVFRLAVTQYYTGNQAESMQLFRNVLALNLPLNSPGRREAEKIKNDRRKSSGSGQGEPPPTATGYTLGQIKTMSLMLGLESIAMQQNGTRVLQLGLAQSQQQGQSRFAPIDFFQARLASLICLRAMRLDLDELFEELDRKAGSDPKQMLIRLYDQLFVAILKSDDAPPLEIAKKAAKIGGDSERMILLEALQESVQPPIDNEELMFSNTSAVRSRVNSGFMQTDAPPHKLLSAEDLQLAVDTYVAMDGSATQPIASPLSNLQSGFQGTRSQIIVQSNGRPIVINIGSTGSDGVSIPIFLMEQARYSNNMAAVAKLDDYILKHSDSSDLLMYIICKRIQQSSAFPLGPWLEKWKSNVEKTLIQLKANRTANNPFAFNGLGEAQLLQLSLTKSTRISADSLKELLTTIVPVYFRVSQALADRQLSRISAISYNTAIQVQEIIPGSSELSFVSQLLVSKSPVLDAQALLQFLKDQRDKSKNLEDRASWDLSLANLHFVNRQYTECVQQMLRVVEVFPEENLYKFALARSLELDGKYFEALKTVQQIVVKDVQQGTHRDLCIIELAIRLGDRQLATPLAEQLLSQQLSNPQSVRLISHLTSLGMLDQAQTLQNKMSAASRRSSAIARSTTPGLGASPTQLTEQQALKQLATTTCEIDADEIPATFVVWRIRTDGLRAARSAGTQSGFSSFAFQSSNSNNPSSNFQRTQALNFLAQAGTLRTMDEKLAEELKQAPDSIVKWSQRLEYQLNIPNTDPVPTLRKLVELRPTSRSFRFMLARSLESDTINDEVFSIYLQLLREHPAWTLNSLRNITSVGYSTDKQRQEFAQVLLEAEASQLKQYQEIVMLSQSLIRREDTRTLGLDLFKHYAQGSASLWISLNGQLPGDKSSSIWEIPEFFDQFIKTMLPDSKSIQNDPWVTSNLLFNDPNGRDINSGSLRNAANLLERFLLGLKYERVLNLKLALSKHIEENPEWLGGTLLMIQTESHLGLDKEANTRLEEFLEKKVVSEIDDSRILNWLIYFSQTFKKLAPGLEEKLLLEVSKNPSTSDALTIPRLLQLCSRSGPSREVRQMLMQFGSHSERVIEIAEAQVKLGYVLDAMRLLLPLRPQNEPTTSDAMAANSLRTTNSPTNASTRAFSNEVRASLDFNDALAKSQKVWPTDQVAMQIFDTEVNSESAINELIVLIPKPQDLFSLPISSPVLEQFALAVEKGDGGERLVQRLKELVSTRPDDLRVTTLDLLWQIRKEQAAPAELIARTQPLLERLNAPIDARTLQHSLELWLIAANLMQSKTYRDDPQVKPLATQLALAAISQAHENRLVNYEAAMLCQWASILASQGQRQLAEEKCREALAALSHSNPDGLRMDTVADQRSIAYGLSQFTQAMSLASFAHTNEMEELRILALNQALGEKLPMAEAGISPALRDLVISIRGKPLSMEMFEVLKLAVFPTSSNKSVRFHAVLRDRMNIEVESVASELIVRAVELNQLDSLSEENLRRSEDRLNYLSMATLIAIAHRRDADALKNLEELSQLIRERKPVLTTALAATVAARKALSNPELATVAKEILAKQGLRLTADFFER